VKPLTASKLRSYNRRAQGLLWRRNLETGGLPKIINMSPNTNMPQQQTQTNSQRVGNCQSLKKWTTSGQKQGLMNDKQMEVFCILYDVVVTRRCPRNGQLLLGLKDDL